MKIRVSKITGITPHRESIYNPLASTPFGEETRNDYLVVDCEMKLFEMEMAIGKFKEHATGPEWAELIRLIHCEDIGCEDNGCDNCPKFGKADHPYPATPE